MANENKGPGFATGLFLGGLLGIALGFLLAPQVGDKTKEQIRSRADEIVARVRERTEQLVTQSRESLREAIEEGKEAASKASTELEVKLEEARGEKI